MANNNFKNMSYEEFVNKVWDDFYSFLDMIKEDPRPNLDKIIPLLSKEEQSIAIDYLVAHDNFIDDVNECVEIIRRIISKLIASLEPSENSLTYSRGIINLFYQTMQLGVLATIEREKIDNFNNFLASAVKRAKERAEFQREKDKLNKLDNLDIIRQDVKEGFITTAKISNDIQEAIKNQRRTSRPKLTQKQAAACCGVTEKTISNWDSGATKAPDWYPGRDVTVVEMKERVKQGKQQDRMAKAVQRAVDSARIYREEEDREEED